MPNFLAQGAWSRKHEACTECGRIDSPHSGKGLCRRCRDRIRDLSPERQEAHRAHMRAYSARKRKALAESGSSGVKPWSRLHAVCVECGGDDRPHAARGLCRGCYDAGQGRKAGQRSRNARRNAQARARYAKGGKPPAFPRLGSLCLIVPTGEVGRIVGYSKAYDEWCVRVDGEPDMHWEPCDLAPYTPEARRAA